MKKKNAFGRRYLADILKNAAKLQEFKKIFSQSADYQDCVKRLKKFREIHASHIVGDERFVSASYAYARRNGFLSDRVNGGSRSWILNESAENQKFFKEEYGKECYRVKNGLQAMRAVLRARGLPVKTTNDILNAAVSLGLPSRTALANRAERSTSPSELVVRKWQNSPVRDMNDRAWLKPGRRTAYFSYGPYRQSGWRAGLFRLACAIYEFEGCHFPVFAGGLTSKEWVKAEIKKLLSGRSRELHESVYEHVKNDVARALQAVLPIFRKPNGDYARWYVMASLPFDGIYGDEILRQLQEMRPDDIRKYKMGGERVEIQMPDGQPSIFHGVVLPKRGRLPARYMSAKVERDIRDVEEQTSRSYPDLWVHGTSATALYKPSGERMVPYISLPAFHKLEAEDKKIAENQSGMTIVEEMPGKQNGKTWMPGDRLIHVWSFRDLIAKERDFITGIKDGASSFHKKIVDILKREGARHPGRLADELSVDRDIIEKEIQFLVEPKRSSRQTWPALHYDEASQRFDFHSDWIQELLRYELPVSLNGLTEDSFLFFGCLHAGYTTTDYEYVVTSFPEILLRYNIENFVGIGDFIAGLVHSMMHRGEIMQMNNTDQERFAGEIIASIIFKVFKERFEKAFKEAKNRTKEHILACIQKSLVRFLIKKGNHDTWQTRDGNTALGEMYNTIILLLDTHIRHLLSEKNVVGIDVMDIVKKKTILLPEHRPVYELPSGMRVGLIHPYMARAETTSLRLEKAMERFSSKWKCQIVGVANFHVAAVAHKWLPATGQCVGVQTGTEVIFTAFEANQLKEVDFGPLYLRTYSHQGRILKTTVASFNVPLLQEPIPKWTDVTALKRKLGLLILD